MAPPARIPIKREPGYHTDHAGRHAEGQFLGGIVGEYLGGWRPGLTREDLRWYVYLHHFDHDGKYLCSDIELAGLNTEEQVAGRARELLAEWLSQLDDLAYGDIAVGLFQTRYDGVLFGLIDESDDDPERGHGGDWVELHPDRLGFHEPWNGEYDT